MALGLPPDSGLSIDTPSYLNEYLVKSNYVLYEYLEVNSDRKISKDLRLLWLIFKAIDRYTTSMFRVPPSWKYT